MDALLRVGVLDFSSSVLVCLTTYPLLDAKITLDGIAYGVPTCPSCNQVGQMNYTKGWPNPKEKKKKKKGRREETKKEKT